VQVILIPGLFGHIATFASLRRRLERAGHTVHEPGFKVTTLMRDELGCLLRVLDEVGPCVLVGHSAGGLLAVLAAQARHPNIVSVIGLGTPMLGKVKLPVPWYEARSLQGLFLPLSGPNETKRFPITHALLPMLPCLQDWIASKLRNEND